MLKRSDSGTKMNDPLEQLPTKILRARTKSGRMVTVLVDGDYDGEYFGQFYLRILPLGYVVLGSERVSVVNNKTGEYTPKKRDGKYHYLHHMVLPAKKGYWVRFKNGNKLDCRSRNLEYVTPSQSALWRPPGRPVGKSGYHGVFRPSSRSITGGRHWVSKTQWQVVFKRQILGFYIDKEEAARAYDTAARSAGVPEYKLNFPKEGI